MRQMPFQDVHVGERFMLACDDFSRTYVKIALSEARFADGTVEFPVYDWEGCLVQRGVWFMDAAKACDCCAGDLPQYPISVEVFGESVDVCGFQCLYRLYDVWQVSASDHTSMWADDDEGDFSSLIVLLITSLIALAIMGGLF